jgi:hypothetical protein
MDAYDSSSERHAQPPSDIPQRARRIDDDGDGNGGENGNGGPIPNPNLRIVGIEATQGIQFFNFNGQGTGTAGDNSLTLVPRKRTVFRVYVDASAQSPGFPVPSSISGFLSVFRVNWPQAPHFEMVGTAPLTPLVSPIPAKPASAIQRASALDTLNFRLEAALSQPGNTAQIAVSATVFDAAHPNDPAYFSEALTRYFSFLPSGVRTTLPIYAVRILYTGPGAPQGATAPSENEVTATLSSSFVVATYPISGIDYIPGGMIIREFNGDLTATASSGSCGAGWNDLLRMLRDMRSASNTSDIYVGFLARNQFIDSFGVPQAGTPTTPAPGGGVIAGCGTIGGGVAAGYVFDPNPANTIGQAAQVTMAQEIGHAMGRLHAPCPGSTAGGIDPSFPAFVTGPAGSIGEVGFNTSTGTTLPPGPMSATFDFMSACSPTWVSPFTYRALFLFENVIAG